MPISATTIAKWFMAFADDTAGADNDLTNMKVQKLLYYAQGHWLAEHDGEPLFPEAVKAWSHGPVVPQVWHEYKRFGRSTLPAPPDSEFDWADVPEEVDQFLTRVWQRYGGYSAVGLRTMTHRDPPWRDASEIASDSPAIALPAMMAHFAAVQLPA